MFQMVAKCIFYALFMVVPKRQLLQQVGDDLPGFLWFLRRCRILSIHSMGVNLLVSPFLVDSGFLHIQIWLWVKSKPDRCLENLRTRSLCHLDVRGV